MKSCKFSVVVEKDKNGYFAFVPELQGGYSQGTTYEEAMENISDAIREDAKRPLTGAINLAREIYDSNSETHFTGPN
jgi:hypothetical protein